MRNGIPFDVAFALDAHEALAYGVILNSFERPDAEFDYDTGGYRRQG